MLSLSGFVPAGEEKNKLGLPQRYFPLDWLYFNKLAYLMFKKSPPYLKGGIWDTPGICLFQIFINFIFLVLNNRNKVSGIKLPHKRKDLHSLSLALVCVYL